MKQIVRCIFSALGISIVIMSCNGDEKKTESTTTGDTAAKATMPAATEPAAKANDMDAAKKVVAGTARSMGIDTELNITK